MIITDDIQIIKAQMAAFLLAFRLEDRNEDISLDMIELVALRMRRREDADVFQLGLFVRTNLACFELGTLSFPDIHARFMAAALAASVGPAEFTETLYLGTRGCQS
ncbi:MAG: hypothetical protein QM647_00095 [Asticcacaulis sp.]|uniref:hypothetical protein n=1 Tax=Asticcacaulis sp. TaxID=1872648 RepID=UPI0039E65222